MIKVRHLYSHDMEAALRGLRASANAFDLPDSRYKDGRFIVGTNDMNLARKQYKKGNRDFMSRITVSCDIAAPMYFWREFEQFKASASDTGMMTAIRLFEFSESHFSHEGLSSLGLDEVVETILETLNMLRDMWEESGGTKYLKAILELLPSGYGMTATVFFDYAVAAKVIEEKVDSPLDEWRELITELRGLPYLDYFMGE